MSVAIYELNGALQMHQSVKILITLALETAPLRIICLSINCLVAAELGCNHSPVTLYVQRKFFRALPPTPSANINQQKKHRQTKSRIQLETRLELAAHRRPPAAIRQILARLFPAGG
jgi:hypothetical protein